MPYPNAHASKGDSPNNTAGIVTERCANQERPRYDLYPTFFVKLTITFIGVGGRGSALPPNLPFWARGAPPPWTSCRGFAPRTPLKILDWGIRLHRACHQLSSVKTTFLYGTAVLFIHFLYSISIEPIFLIFLFWAFFEGCRT